MTLSHTFIHLLLSRPNGWDGVAFSTLTMSVCTYEDTLRTLHAHNNVIVVDYQIHMIVD